MSLDEEDAMPEPKKRVALVTGCSSGIGHATALRLHQAGLVVYATARHKDRLADLAAEGIHTLALDVTEEESMAAAVGQVTADHGAVEVLVNNAGFELVGPIEDVPLAEARRQFDTNYFGVVRLVQLTLPGMRERRYGRIINVSSVFGRFAVAGNAYYAGTKHALAALTDALRMEGATFGIRAVLVEPTAARTRLETNAVWASAHPDGPYYRLHKELERWHAETYDGPPHNVAGRLAVTADQVADVITKAATSNRPRERYPVGLLAHGLFALRRYLPAPAFDAFVRTQFPMP
jgi:NAD(P)-dependent dehydrogenase (short-subunit alcohol dehydrogenase family)